MLSLKVGPPDQTLEQQTEVVLPQVLEEVLALKNQRALELGNDENAAAGAVANAPAPTPSGTQRDPLWEKDENVVSFIVIIL